MSIGLYFTSDESTRNAYTNVVQQDPEGSHDATLAMPVSTLVPESKSEIAAMLEMNGETGELNLDFLRAGPTLGPSASERDAPAVAENR